jgi:hypothetical protein
MAQKRRSCFFVHFFLPGKSAANAIDGEKPRGKVFVGA